MGKKKKLDPIQYMLGESAEYLPQAATIFVNLVAATPEARPELLDKLHAIEQDSDERYIKVLRKTAGTFITPFDREDIYVVIEALDDVVDQLDQVGALIVGFEIGALPDDFLTMANELVEMSEQIRQALPLLKKQHKLERRLTGVNTHIHEFANAYRSLLVSALDTRRKVTPDAGKILTLGASLERACHKVAELNRALVVVAIKET